MVEGLRLHAAAAPKKGPGDAKPLAAVKEAVQVQVNGCQALTLVQFVLSEK